MRLYVCAATHVTREVHTCRTLRLLATSQTDTDMYQCHTNGLRRSGTTAVGNTSTTRRGSGLCLGDLLPKLRLNHTRRLHRISKWRARLLQCRRGPKTHLWSWFMDNFVQFVTSHIPLNGVTYVALLFRSQLALSSLHSRIGLSSSRIGLLAIAFNLRIIYLE